VARRTNPRTGAWIEPAREGEDLVMERLMKPRTGKADGHVHLDYVESFEVLEGTAGTPHVNPYNDTEADLRLRHRVSPSSAFAEAFLSALGHHMENATVNDQGEFSDLQLFVVLHGTRAKSYRTGIPIWVQKAVLPVGAAIGRMRGLRPGYD
jgi:hypothetical protein